MEACAGGGHPLVSPTGGKRHTTVTSRPYFLRRTLTLAKHKFSQNTTRRYQSIPCLFIAFQSSVRRQRTRSLDNGWWRRGGFLQHQLKLVVNEHKDCWHWRSGATTDPPSQSSNADNTTWSCHKSSGQAFWKDTFCLMPALRPCMYFLLRISQSRYQGYEHIYRALDPALEHVGAVGCPPPLWDTLCTLCQSKGD